MPGEKIRMNEKRNFVGDIRPCSRCGETMIVTERMCKYGNYTCSSCRSKSAAEYSKAHREWKRQANSRYLKSHPDGVARRSKKYRQANPEKYKAHTAVHSALRNGTLVRGVCEVCGETVVEAHHDDYSKPLDVRWLCHKHHCQHHI